MTTTPLPLALRPLTALATALNEFNDALAEDVNIDELTELQAIVKERWSEINIEEMPEPLRSIAEALSYAAEDAFDLDLES